MTDPDELPPKPPWTSPLADLPDLTEEQCRKAMRVVRYGDENVSVLAQIGRALIAAGWTPEEEA